MRAGFRARKVQVESNKATKTLKELKEMVVEFCGLDFSGGLDWVIRG